jgi:IclR family acetate operon transcriptional repressor
MVLGKAFERSNNYVSIVRPILRQLAKSTGESATFFVRRGSDRFVLVREEGTQEIRYLVKEGQRLALHAGAGGKILLAFGPEKIRRKILINKRVPGITPYTITDSKKLSTELDRVHSMGHAFSQAEATLDAASIAAPVFNYENKLVGALAIAGPISRFNETKKIDYLKQVLETAHALSIRLGWNQTHDMEKIVKGLINLSKKIVDK